MQPLRLVANPFPEETYVLGPDQLRILYTAFDGVWDDITIWFDPRGQGDGTPGACELPSSKIPVWNDQPSDAHGIRTSVDAGSQATQIDPLLLSRGFRELVVGPGSKPASLTQSELGPASM